MENSVELCRHWIWRQDLKELEMNILDFQLSDEQIQHLFNILNMASGLAQQMADLKRRMDDSDQPSTSRKQKAKKGKA